ncbi:hypothetical protein ACQVP2_02625 [Methylobacterium aquaticum]|uniref:hypothetical protein n=1 Tax=Methylobacterium aquaticum TaxID=270351 RepID=UPI003D1740EE
MTVSPALTAGTHPALGRFRRSGHRFGDKNLRQNKNLSGRSGGLPTQACLGEDRPDAAEGQRDRRLETLARRVTGPWPVVIAVWDELRAHHPIHLRADTGANDEIGFLFEAMAVAERFNLLRRFALESIKKDLVAPGFDRAVARYMARQALADRALADRAFLDRIPARRGDAKLHRDKNNAFQSVSAVLAGGYAEAGRRPAGPVRHITFVGDVAALAQARLNPDGPRPSSSGMPGPDVRKGSLAGRTDTSAILITWSAAFAKLLGPSLVLDPNRLAAREGVAILRGENPEFRIALRSILLACDGQALDEALGPALAGAVAWRPGDLEDPDLAMGLRRRRRETIAKAVEYADRCGALGCLIAGLDGVLRTHPDGMDVGPAFARWDKANWRLVKGIGTAA